MLTLAKPLEPNRAAVALEIDKTGISAGGQRVQPMAPDIDPHQAVAPMGRGIPPHGCG